jgi:gliding motility-associated-like protein
VIPVQTLPPQHIANRQYQFYLQYGTSLTDTTGALRAFSHPAGAQPDTVAFRALNSGFWTAAVMDMYSHCLSPSITVGIDRAPDLAIEIINKTAVSTCGTSNGLIEVRAGSDHNQESPPPGPGFDFQWYYHGTGSEDPGLPLAAIHDGNETDFRSEKIGLLSGFYSIEVFDRATGCGDSIMTNLESQEVPLALITHFVPSDQCEPGNGRIEFEISAETGSNAIEDYLIHLFEGPEIDESRILASIKPAVGTPYPYSNQFSAIRTGIYTVAIREDFGTNECYSDKTTGEITYSGPVPNLLPVTLSEDFSCAGAIGGTGQLSEVNLSLTGYEFIWYAGTDTTAAGMAVHGAADQSDNASWIPDNPQTGDNLFAGVYTLVARDRVGPGLGCVYTGRHVLPGAQKAIEIVQAPVTDKTHCSIDNGTAGVFSVRENGGAEIRVDTTDYRYFELLNSGFSVLQHTTAGPAPVLGTAAQPFAGLSPGAFYLVAMDTRTRCLSQPKNIGIGQATNNPSVVIRQLSPDFNCTGAYPTGALLAEVNGDTLAVSFDIRWHQGPDTSQSALDTHFLADGLSAPAAGQIYTAVVTDRDASDGNLGCQSIVQSLLRFSPTEVSIPATELLIDPITTCALPPDGFATVLNIRENFLNGTVTGTGPSYAARYELQLLDDQYAPIDPLAFPFAASDAASGMFNHIPEGFYYVRARNLITGCEFGPGTRFGMTKTSAAPVLQISAPQADFSCTGGTPTGIARLSSVAGGSDGDGNHTHFSYSWIQEANGTPTAPDGSLVPSGASQLPAGIYAVTVTDLSGPDSLCAAEVSVEIPRMYPDFLIAQAQAEPQYVCYPAGTAQAVSLQLGGAAIGLPDSLYSILLFDSSMQEIGSATAGSGLPADPFSGLSPGQYFLQAVDLSTQCNTAPYAVLVEDLSQNPVIATTLHSPQYSLNPNPATWTGMLSSVGTEAGGHRYPQGYHYQWHAGTEAAGPVISADSVMWGLDEGYYTLQVTSDSTQCVSRQTAFVPFVYLRPSFDPVPSPQMLCRPADGSLFIPEIYLEGILDTLSEYTFRAYHGQYHTGAPDSVFAGEDPGNAYGNLGQGGYYFVARENDWWVESYPVRAEIENHAPYPVLLYDADNSLNQTSCDPSVAANGAVAVTATEENGLPGVYHYTWYGPAGQLMDSTDRRVSGIPAGVYRVEVTNTLTGCVSSALLPIGDHPVVPAATASTAPLTNCDLSRANGAVSGFVTNALSAFGQDSDYIFNWYAGSSIKTAADHTGQVWNGLTDGTYTLQTVDRLNTTCVSPPVTVMVARQTVNPLLNINEISPLTNCDPAKANAVFEATADGGVTGFSFEWKDASGVVVSSSPRVINLGNQTYTLLAMNTVTGCWSEVPLHPSVSLDVVPAPLVDLLNGRTSCLEPDGRASASVQGDMAGYIFRFYPAGSDLPLGNDYSGTVLHDLDTGTYYVTAESRASGCISAPAPFRIHDATYFPEFLLVAQPSSCDEPTGSAEVVIGDLNRPHKINWYDRYGYVGGEEYMNFLPVGRFTVEVEGTEGCMTVHEVDVTGDITIYNGVSVNGDGLNDFFQVKCLEFFPDNKVRIFNRAGNLVYEMDFYDMHDPNRRFDGESNRGMNIGGTSLPEGTYYYIVDKMDGSEPKVGYLELKR